jgi:hypothetical protein
MSALYPDVPVLPGIPAVLRLAGSFLPAPVLLLADRLGLLGAFGAPSWGIFRRDGSLAITADSVVGVDIGRDWRIASHPVEAGGFGSYNKVATPFDVRVILTASGSDANRANLLAQVDAACASLALFTVITPEFFYPSANLVSYRLRRSADRGVKLLQVEVGVEEVRIANPTQFTKGEGADTSAAKDPAAASPANGGTVSATAADAGQARAAASFNPRAHEAPGGF